MLLLELDPESPIPAYLQIRDRIVAMIDDGTLQPGDRLPPTRSLASSVGVHRSTVVRAFEEIRALGYLESRPGSYTTVRRRTRPPAITQRRVTGSALIDWNIRGRASTGGAPDPYRPRSLARPGDRAIDFERLAADPDLAPADELRRWCPFGRRAKTHFLVVFFGRNEADRGARRAFPGNPHRETRSTGRCSWSRIGGGRGRSASTAQFAGSRRSRVSR